MFPSQFLWVFFENVIVLLFSIKFAASSRFVWFLRIVNSHFSAVSLLFNWICDLFSISLCFYLTGPLYVTTIQSFLQLAENPFLIKVIACCSVVINIAYVYHAGLKHASYCNLACWFTVQQKFPISTKLLMQFLITVTCVLDLLCSHLKQANN